MIEINAFIQKSKSLNQKNSFFDIIYEDIHLIIINKPKNVVVHPGVKNSIDTILNKLIDYYPPIIDVPRAGIIHRLDKNTTGLMIIAKNTKSRLKLIKLLQEKNIIKEYEAITVGLITTGGTINKPIARNHQNRVCMSVCQNGKEAVTHYRIIEHFRNHTRLRLRLETGRMHQIRVHMSYIKHHLVGDKLYGKCPKILINTLEECKEMLKNFKRQALHAIKLQFDHPFTNISMTFHAPLPSDMRELIKILRKDKKSYLEKIKFSI